MMTVLVIGFNAATRTEQMAARNYSYQEQANQMAMLGVNQAVAMLNTNLTNWSARTQPGRVMTTENGPLPLTSESVPGASGPTNVNAWADSNFWIAPTTNPAAFAVPAVEVRRGTNRIGGYAFWVDDDGSRLNLNAASTTARTNFLPTNARPLVLNRDLFPAITANFWTGISNGFNALVNSNPTTSTNGWSYFFTPRQIVSISNIGTANYNTMMFHIGAGPLNWRPVEILTESKVRSVPIESGVPVTANPFAPTSKVFAALLAVELVRMLTAYVELDATNALKPTANRMV
jgi:hypothetical protein